VPNKNGEEIMPIYTYKCQKCGETFDFLIMKKSEEPTCPKCGAVKVEKQLTAPASIRMGNSSQKGTTCCGRSARCDLPPCSSGGICER